MSVKMIQDRLDGYACRSTLEEEQALREITQEIVLAVAYVDAKKGNMIDAISYIGMAAGRSPGDQFVQSVAGQLIAWADSNPQPPLPDLIAKTVERVRQAMNGQAAYVASYNQAKAALAGQPAQGQAAQQAAAQQAAAQAQAQAAAQAQAQDAQAQAAQAQAQVQAAQDAAQAQAAQIAAEMAPQYGQVLPQVLPNGGPRYYGVNPSYWTPNYYTPHYYNPYYTYSWALRSPGIIWNGGQWATHAGPTRYYTPRANSWHSSGNTFRSSVGGGRGRR